MSLPRRFARFNRKFANPVVGGILSRMPGFASVVHRGRRSGRSYRTPVKVFRRHGEYVIVLPYGPDSDWVKNVMAAGGGELKIRGRRIPVVAPRIFVDEKRTAIPLPLRPIMRAFRADHFIAVRPADSTTPPTAGIPSAQDGSTGAGRAPSPSGGRSSSSA